MNVLKNFEAVFVVAVAVAAGASYFAHSSESGKAAAAQFASVATPSQMAVVKVVGKRMSAIEKQRSLEEERGLAKAGAANGSRT